MQYELKEEMGVGGSAFRVIVADERFAAELVEKDTRVMVVVGVECFDNQLRALHPRGFMDHLPRLRAHVEKRNGNCLVVAVAESYKRVENLADDEKGFDCCHNVGRVEMVGRGVIDLIVSDLGIDGQVVPGDWQDVVKRRGMERRKGPDEPGPVADGGT
jgi:hypothetical protein